MWREWNASTHARTSTYSSTTQPQPPSGPDLPRPYPRRWRILRECCSSWHLLYKWLPAKSTRRTSRVLFCRFRNERRWIVEE